MNITTGGESKYILVKDVLYVHREHAGVQTQLSLCYTWTKLIIAATLTAHTATTPPTGDLQEQYTGVAMSRNLDYVRATTMAHKAVSGPSE